MQRLREIFQELVAQGAACLDLVTPTHFADAVLEALGQDPWPVPVVWNCGGYESVETLRRLEGRVQVYLPDFKYALAEPAARYSGAGDYPGIAKAAILEMFRQTGAYRMEGGTLQSGVLIRHLQLPGELENTKAGHRLGGGEFPPRRGALFPHEPVHAPAGCRRKAGAAGDGGGVPGGGAAIWRTAAFRMASPRSEPPPGRSIRRISICRVYKKIKEQPLPWEGLLFYCTLASSRYCSACTAATAPSAAAVMACRRDLRRMSPAANTPGRLVCISSSVTM